MIDLSVLTVPNLVASVVAGLVSGVSLPFFLPLDRGVALFRRAALIAAYFGFLLTLLYAARYIALSVNHDPTAGRIIAAWLLAILFAVCIGAGAALGAIVRDRNVTR